MAFVMPPLKPDTALVFAAAAAASFAFAAAASGGSLEDVQIGEKGDVLRVALICSARCEVVPGDGVDFRLAGIAANYEIDLAGRSGLATRLTIKASGGASIVSIGAKGRINAARIIPCATESGPASCIEYRFETHNARSPAAASEPILAPKLRGDMDVEAASAAKEDIPFIGAMIAPQPALRDEPETKLKLPQFAPPERLTPPASEHLGDLPANIDVGRPSLIVTDRAAALGRGSEFDFKLEAIDILGKAFDVGACEGAKMRLLADAWALGAMIDYAYCKAAAGKLDEADADFARLLAYTPDNYEALVGRGLIAFAGGDRKRGQALFQEALNALPPIAESDRIVAAMERN